MNFSLQMKQEHLETLNQVQNQVNLSLQKWA